MSDGIMGRFSEKELKLVKNLDVKSKTVARLLNRDIKAIQDKRHNMKKSLSTGKRIIKKFTPKEEEMLLDVSIKHGELGKLLNRTKDSIRTARQRRGIYLHKRKTNEKIDNHSKYTKEELFILNDTSIPHSKAAELLGKDYMQVYNARYAKGIKILMKEETTTTNTSKRTRGKFNKMELALIDDVTLTAKTVALALDTTQASISTVRVRRNIVTAGKSIRGKIAVLGLSGGQKAAETRKRNQEAKKSTPKVEVENYTYKAEINANGHIVKSDLIKKEVKTKDLQFIINGVPIAVDGKIKNARIGLNKIEINF